MNVPQAGGLCYGGPHYGSSINNVTILKEEEKESIIEKKMITNSCIKTVVTWGKKSLKIYNVIYGRPPIW